MGFWKNSIEQRTRLKILIPVEYFHEGWEREEDDQGKDCVVDPQFVDHADKHEKKDQRNEAEKKSTAEKGRFLRLFVPNKKEIAQIKRNDLGNADRLENDLQVVKETRF